MECTHKNVQRNDQRTMELYCIHMNKVNSLELTGLNEFRTYSIFRKPQLLPHNIRSKRNQTNKRNLNFKVLYFCTMSTIFPLPLYFSTKEKLYTSKIPTQKGKMPLDNENTEKRNASNAGSCLLQNEEIRKFMVGFIKEH